MARSRTIIVAGAGIGGLAAALALIHQGFRVVVFEQAEGLEETGAGIQLSPNATGILFALGVGERLKARAVAPEAIRVVRAASAREIVRIPLGRAAALRFGAPYWVIHRADLQAGLIEALEASPDFVLRLGSKVEDFAVHAHGVTVHARGRSTLMDERGIALVAADGLWSSLRPKLGDRSAPRFRRRTAWRALVAADRVPPPAREAATVLWLGPDAHLVHYPVKGGQMINLVAIVRDDRPVAGWSAAGRRGDLAARFVGWHDDARALIRAPQTWQRWSLYDRALAHPWGAGPVTLLGDAAHAMLPFLAQGGAMAIEDAAVLAACLARHSDEPAVALRLYEGLRRARTARAQRQARRNGRVYHLKGAAALARDLALAAFGGDRLLGRYDWLYDWRP
ncbi:MAG TPA: FAD-dependent monooxygenase [Xanthobacteraceae bacterium]|nr:FAD-dependent monooxygenase [Xanthobacteraceae bacterium]